MYNLNKNPIILDGDIGRNSDTVLSLCYLLKKKNINFKMITTCYENNNYDSVKVINKILNITQNSEIIVGKGKVKHNKKSPFDKYLSGIHANNAPNSELLLENFVRQSPCPIVLITIGSMENISSIISKDENLACKINLISLLDKSDIRQLNFLDKIYNCSWKSIKIIPNDCVNMDIIKDQYIMKKTCVNDAYSQIITSLLTQNNIKNFPCLLTILIALHNSNNIYKKGVLNLNQDQLNDFILEIRNNFFES